jgi:hypothetical protein
VQYTRDLIAILTALLPPGLDGGISTAPLSYKPWLPAPTQRDWNVIVHHLADIAGVLVSVHRETGKSIHLDIEPEPDCLLSNTDETIHFFEQHLFREGAATLARRSGLTPAAAGDALRDHIRLCFDCCHFSVEHEDPVTALGRLSAAGIRIGRVQLSSALTVPMPADPAAAATVSDRLRPFADSTYLHQVVIRHREHVSHFRDLGDALSETPLAGQWRIHFHVPLFAREYSALGSSRDDVAAVLRAVQRDPFTRHLEIETYTWDVLPGDLKLDLLESIGREYEWVLGQFQHASEAAASDDRA